MEMCDQIIYNLTLNLQIMEESNEDTLEKYSKSISECQSALEDLRKRKLVLGISKTEIEIDFFKNKKTFVLSKLLYYVKMYTRIRV